MKGHLKRNFVPKSWLIARKENTFIIRPNPSAYPMDLGLPLAIALKDLHYAKTTKEAKEILLKGNLLVDGKKHRSVKFLVGIMDVLSFPSLKKNYRVLLNKKGKIQLKEIDEKESAIKICKIVGKHMIKGGKLQISLHDGRNMLTKDNFKVGDSIILSLKENKIEKKLELKKGAFVYLWRGKYAGTSGVVEEIKEERIIYLTKKGKIETLKKYALVVGEKESEIKLENEN